MTRALTAVAADQMATWPKQDGRFVCTAERPMPQPSPGGAWLHPDAEDAGTCHMGCCDRYQCPHCGVRWLKEMPD